MSIKILKISETPIQEQIEGQENVILSAVVQDEDGKKQETLVRMNIKDFKNSMSDKKNEIVVENGRVYVKNGDVNIELVKAYHTYGVSIDLSDSNPESAVRYIDDAVGMVADSPDSPDSSDWDETSIFNNIKPCLFKDGEVVGYLNPDNFAQFADGTAADITSGDSGDVMIEIPKIGIKIASSEDTLTVQITDDPNKKGFSYKAHTRAEDGDREKLYIGAFLGYIDSSGLRSLSGKVPTRGDDINDFRFWAQANGQGYEQLAFYQLTLLQCLFLIRYKSRDSQTALGMGHVADSNWKYEHRPTGATVKKGMNYGPRTPLEQIKFLGIEDFWGYLSQWIDGLRINSEGHILTATDDFNSSGQGYTDCGQIMGEKNYIGGFLKIPHGTNELGFIMKESGGSATTYFSDICELKKSQWSHFGGHFNTSYNAGAFCLAMTNSTDRTSGRLMFL